MNKKSEDYKINLRGPRGTVVFLEDVKSLRGVRINNTTDAMNLFQVDIVTLDGDMKYNYTCSFHCLSLICALLYSESDAEDKTVVSFTFEALVNIMTLSKITEGSEDKNFLDEAEEAYEELLNRPDTTVLN